MTRDAAGSSARSRPAIVDDEALASRVGAGDVEALRELVRRYGHAAWRVAVAVTGDPRDAGEAVAEAFVRVLGAAPARPGRSPLATSLLGAARAAAAEATRRSGRTGPAPEAWNPSSAEPPSAATEPRGDARALDESSSASLPASRSEAEVGVVGAALWALPERWRSALWLLEAEGVPEAEVASMLGLTPGATARIAERAREAVRARLLDAETRDATGACQPVVALLAASLAGGLSGREASVVERHLRGCERCRTRRAELADLSGSLRRAIVPPPAGLEALVVARFRQATRRGGILELLGGIPETARKPLAGASLALLALGIIGASVASTTSEPLPPLVNAVAPEQTRTPPTVTHTVTLAGSTLPFSVTGQAHSRALPSLAAGERAAGGPQASDQGSQTTAGHTAAEQQTTSVPGPGSGSGPSRASQGRSSQSAATSPPGSGAGSGSAAPILSAEASAHVGTLSVAASLGIGGQGCTGLAVGALAVGCSPAAGSTSHGSAPASASVGSSLLASSPGTGAVAAPVP
jgi:RNA polymerase sigma factor (sigma-70 family)